MCTLAIFWWRFGNRFRQFEDCGFPFNVLVGRASIFDPFVNIIFDCKVNSLNYVWVCAFLILVLLCFPLLSKYSAMALLVISKCIVRHNSYFQFDRHMLLDQFTGLSNRLTFIKRFALLLRAYSLHYKLLATDHEGFDRHHLFKPSQSFVLFFFF